MLFFSCPNTRTSVQENAIGSHLCPKLNRLASRSTPGGCKRERRSWFITTPLLNHPPKENLSSKKLVNVPPSIPYNTERIQRTPILPPFQASAFERVSERLERPSPPLRPPQPKPAKKESVGVSREAKSGGGGREGTDEFDRLVFPHCRNPAERQSQSSAKGQPEREVGGGGDALMYSTQPTRPNPNPTQPNPTRSSQGRERVSLQLGRGLFLPFRHTPQGERRGGRTDLHLPPPPPIHKKTPEPSCQPNANPTQRATGKERDVQLLRRT